MRTGTLLSAASIFLCVGLLVLSGVFPAVRHASAQTACPLPAGVTPPPPVVTAQQVEDGSASLMAFSLAVRDQLGQRVVATAEEAVYIGCLLRQEGSPYRSGSTYLVQLTPDRIFFHAKAMALSGRLLNPLIYGAILQALGIDPADLSSPASALAAFAVAAGNGGAFNVPGIPGASGYATTYTGPSTRLPTVLLAGFDLDASHVAQEDIDHGDPSVTAGDVVDRATLKTFVTQAGEFFLEHQTSGDLADSSRARTALRDPTGPWRHDSVYLYVLDLNSNVIMFHAAFPNRFELRPLVPTVRDAVTGEFILPQVIEAAKSGPEGGFVEYYFDDPTDATDSADIPKVGYARQFSGEIRAPGGVIIPVSFIIGSGYYLSSPEVIAASRNTAVKSVLPQVMRAMTASAVDAVSGRIERATSAAAPAAGFSLGGASTLPDVLLTHGRALGNGTTDPGQLLADSSFAVSLNAAGDGSGSPLGHLTFWGRGDYRSLSGGSPQSLGYDGSVVSASLGVDTRLGANLLAGAAVSQARGAVDYSGSGTLTGELTASLTSVSPYVGWGSSGGMSLWAMAGLGSGELEIDDPAAGAQTSDLTQQMAAAGVSGALLSSDRMIAGGRTSLRLKGEVAFTSADIKGSESLASASLRTSRQRLMFEGSHRRELASGATLTPSIELGLRHDGGDGETGAGVEVGGALRYANAASGLTVEGRVRTLLGHGSDYEEWGVSGLVRVDPGAAGRGLALVVQPAWGRADSGCGSAALPPAHRRTTGRACKRRSVTAWAW